MDFRACNPYVRYTEKVRNGESYKTELTAFDYRLFYGLKNSCTICLEGENYRLSENDLLIFPPEHRYKILFEREKPFYFYLFNFDLDGEFYGAQSRHPMESDSFDPSLCFSSCRIPPFDRSFYLRNVPSLAPLLADIYSSNKEEVHFRSDIVSAKMKLFLIASAALERSRQNPSMQKTEQLRLYLEKHFSENTDNAQIAEHFGYHPYYLNQCFLKAYGCTIHRYRNRKRIQYAEHLLLSTGKSVEEIAHEVGFDNPSWFSECFKAERGIAPSAFRKSAR